MPNTLLRLPSGVARFRSLPAPPSVRRSLARLTLELVVVFVGVSAAFLVESHRLERIRAERAQQIYRALAQEIDVVLSVGPAVDRLVGERMRLWREQRARGERPAPVFFHETSGERPPTGAWQATQLSGGLEVIDPELFFRLVRYYNRVESVGDRYQRYNAFTESEILPLMEAGGGAFYTSGGELEGRFQAHMSRLEELSALLRALAEEAGPLRAEIGARLQGPAP